MNLTPKTNSNPQHASAFLRDAWLERRAKNVGYSTRAFARDLGVSQSLLSLVLNGKRPVTVELAARAASILGFDQAKTGSFLKATAQDHPKKAHSFRKLSTLVDGVSDSMFAPKIRNLELERFRLISRWYQLAILDYLTLHQADTSASAIAKTFGITEIEVRDALERLEVLELAIQNDNGVWRKTNQHVRFPVKKTSVAIREYHLQMLERAREVLQNSTNNAICKRSMNGMTVGIVSSRLPEAMKLISNFQDKLSTFLSTGDADDVYQLNIQLFPLTKNQPKKRI